MVKISLNESVNGKSAEEKPYYKVEIVSDRQNIIDKLNGICNQLLKWGLANNPGDVRRVHFFRAAIYATSVQLQALHDAELDELRMDIEGIKKQVGMVKQIK